MIELEGIHRHYRVGDQEVRALDGIDLRIEDGEYVSVMGPSGSGKSTLLHLIGLLDRPTAGRYRLDGRDVTALDDKALAEVQRRHIGFVFQFFHLVPRMTAAENVELPLILEGVDPAERRESVARALAAVGMSDRADHRPDQLSGGQRQRVAIARATIMRPGLLLADEPTGNLDRASGHDIVAVLEALNREGVTLIVVTHDPELGNRAGRRLKLRDGRLVSDLRAGTDAARD
ncbi:ABC transporter ATP-binding protein [Thiohalobacter sp.]|uniref:ABC transporter ATP-binding protein n=1 Tax=Thiohalobacter sp. TaxID=2025948 RepID=UPI002613EAF4|nr:ABC transporter ATP-binding protein [Thiohalobacter sp.]